MLASIIANLQNVPRVERTERPVGKLPTVKIDRGGGGGPLWSTSYDFIDIMAAIQQFPEIAGEDPATRMARRLRWIAAALPKIKEAREKREAAAFLAGASLADAASAEEQRKLIEQLKIEELLEIVDEARAKISARIAAPTPSASPDPVPVPAPAPTIARTTRDIGRGERGAGSGSAAVVVIGLGIAFSLMAIRSFSSSSRSRPRR